jgi:Tat protein secretion system quality control protein TatD with DNase activity
LDIMANIKQQYYQRSKNARNNKNNTITNLQQNPTFPISKIYFHAYGGKLNTVLQILSLCEGMNHKQKPNTHHPIAPTINTTTTNTKCYFGFAPCVNFRAPKTADIIRSIGLSRLLLETDLEDLSLVSSSLQDVIQFIATVLNIDTTTVIEQTTKNAIEFYNLSEYSESNVNHLCI